MKEEKIIIEIDEFGQIKAEAKDFIGEICLKEMEKLFDGIQDIEKIRKKDDFYKKSTSIKRKSTIRR